MKLGIICAMEEELRAIQNAANLELENSYVYAGIHFFEYISTNNFKFEKIYMVLSGLGKVNAAMTTQLLIDKFAVDNIINVGVAGSLRSDLTFGDVVIAKDLVQHDIDTTTFGDKLGQVPRLDTYAFACDNRLNNALLKVASSIENKVVTGRIITGDQFIDDAKKVKFLQEYFKASACEMEGAAIAHVCYRNHVAFSVVRALSDMAGQDGAGTHSFNELKEMASNVAAVLISSFILNFSN